MSLLVHTPQVFQHKVLVYLAQQRPLPFKSLQMFVAIRSLLFLQVFFLGLTTTVGLTTTGLTTTGLTGFGLTTGLVTTGTGAVFGGLYFLTFQPLFHRRHAQQGFESLLHLPWRTYEAQSDWDGLSMHV